MSTVITSSLAAAQSTARDFLARHADESDVMSGLARRVLASGLVKIPTMASSPPNPIDVEMLRRSPILSALGYRLDQCATEIQEIWIDGVERLRGREAFPGDGQSYVHHPGELLGLLCGLESMSDVDHGHREWFQILMQRGLSESKFRTPITRLAAHICISVLGSKEIEFDSIRDDLDALAISSDMLQAAAMLLAFCPAWGPALRIIESRFMHKLMVEPIALSNPAEAAAALVLSKRIVDRYELVDGSNASPVDLIVALCRRFPLFAKQLENRHGNRSPLIIKDEYDVQDLFHAILRLHFDDVRAEDVSPDFGGNTARVDFYLPRDRIAIEAKMTRSGLSQKKVTNELIEDVTRYSAKDGVDTLICLVFDPDGRCTNPRAMESDLAQSATRLQVLVVVCPQGT